MLEGNGLGGVWEEESTKERGWFRRYTPAMCGKVFPVLGDSSRWSWTLVVRPDGTTAGYSYARTSEVQAQSECDGAAIATLMRWTQEGEPKQPEFLGVLVVPDEFGPQSAGLVDRLLEHRGQNVLTVRYGDDLRFIPSRLYVTSADEAAKYAGMTEEIMALAKAKLEGQV